MEKDNGKIEVKHALTSKPAAMFIYKGLFDYRYVPLNSLFDYLQVDDYLYYNFKLKLDCAWYHNQTMNRLYKYNSIFMNFTFRNKSLPKRCVSFHKGFTDEVYNHLKFKGDRVSKLKIKVVTKHLIKHVSRLKFHKKYAITYTRNPKYWREYGDNLSWVYMDKVIDYMVDIGVAHNFTGGIRNGVTEIASILIINPEFIDKCNGKVEFTSGIDECLLQPKLPLVEIRNEDKIERKPTKEERIEVSNMATVVEEYCNLLSKKTVSINGISVPELFFRRIATVDLDHGCRWYDDGTIQQEDATSRSSVLIDFESTVEVDYSSLHFSLAAEELKLDLKGKDPYMFPFEISVDYGAIEQWKMDYGFDKKYDPLRNLKKMALLTMFNAKSEKSAISAISKALRDDYRKEESVKRKFVGLSNVPVTDLVAKLRESNKEIESYLMTGVGLRFQKLDSEMITYCIKKFMEVGEVCIPIHDSIVVKFSQKSFAEKCMIDAYEHVMGSKINCKVK